MKSKPFKIALTAFVLLLAFSGLLYSTLRDGTEYYKHVDEVMGDPGRGTASASSCTATSWTGRSCRSRTRCSTASRSRTTARSCTADYTGIVPDRFKSGSEVVLKGQLNAHGFAVEPGGVMAKCPSKYAGQPS